MKKIYGLLCLLAVLIWCGSCNDEWKEEQYERFISFKAPIRAKDAGVTPIYVRYKEDKPANYKLPVIVSGSTTNDKNITVYVGVDSDTLKILNQERFQSRTDYYYKELESRFFTIPETVGIKAGEDVGLMNIDFNFSGIDMVYKWVLPLTVLSDPSGNYTPHPRKHYKKALLRVIPFNDYSGNYSAVSMKTFYYGQTDDPHDPEEIAKQTPMVRSQTSAYVVDENAVFIYAGMINEDRKDRNLYKIFIRFNKDTGFAELSMDNPNVKFSNLGHTEFYVTEAMDPVKPYLKRRYVTISGIEYEYTDYTDLEGVRLRYYVTGAIILERVINTQIPDEDQAIEW